MAQFKRLFFDLETSPNIGFFWRTGYKLQIPECNIIKERAIICASWKWAGEKKVYNCTWDADQDDKCVVEALAAVLLEADEVVGHNMDRFDLPWFNTRCLFHELPPQPIHKTVDTLVIARRRFYFNSNRLDYIANLLGIGAKHKTDHDLWRSIVLDKCPKAMKRMVRYCDHDVRLTEEVYDRLAPYHAPKTHVGVVLNGERYTCPHCGDGDVEHHKVKITAKGIRQHQFKCKKCGKYHTASDLVNRMWNESLKT